MTIITKYLGPTDTKGSRIRVRSGTKDLSLTVAYDYDADPHRAALKEFCTNFGYEGEFVEGYTSTGRIYIHLDNEHVKVDVSGS